MIALELELSLEQNLKFAQHVEALAKLECSKDFFHSNKHAEHVEELVKWYLNIARLAQEKELLKRWKLYQ